MELQNNTVIRLNTEQNLAYENILAHPNVATLLYGVTGSGKTEVYLKLAQTIIASGKKVLILVPEIALTPQMSARFRAVFGDSLCVLHSGLAQMEYIREWLKINFELPQIVLGVRTAVFCPLKNLGLIIVDEEHDSSYKCSEQPCYNSRDVAVVRAKIEGAICVLGSATPSIESYYNVQTEKYNYIEMREKYSSQKTESVVINAKEEFNLKKGYLNTKFLKASFVEFDDMGLCSSVISFLRQNKQKSQQSMILINRRGYVNYALCSSCSKPLTCPNCAVSTTLHQKGLKEICHYCGFTTETRKKCLSCGGNSFLFKGIGTQNIEEKLKLLLPDLRIARLDKDVFTSNSRLTKIINDFRCGEIDCLIGTQLLAKGHDFANVTLVIILHVEDSLFIPDFRSAERTFQLITQAMGRAGRGEMQGRVILQSFIMNHPVVEFAILKGSCNHANLHGTHHTAGKFYLKSLILT
ncbi:MAG: primosomal protein N' [Bdellovibrionota bacterium]